MINRISYFNTKNIYNRSTYNQQNNKKQTNYSSKVSFCASKIPYFGSPGEIFKCPSWAEIVSNANRCMGCNPAPCVDACPNHNPIPTIIKTLTGKNPEHPKNTRSLIISLFRGDYKTAGNILGDPNIEERLKQVSLDKIFKEIQAKKLIPFIEEMEKKAYERAGEIIGVPDFAEKIRTAELDPSIRNINYKAYSDANRELTEANPLAKITCRVCNGACSSKCNLSTMKGEKPITFRDIEGFLSEIMQPDFEIKPPTGKKIGIVGGGFGGLFAAFKTAIEGHDVTVFEAKKVLGGLMSNGISKDRLPEHIPAFYFDLAKKLGIKFKTDTAVGRDVSIKDLEAFDAVFVSTGSGKARKLALPGIDSKGVYSANDFLQIISDTKRDGLSGFDKPLGNVLTIGGGDVSGDVVNSAYKLEGTGTLTVTNRGNFESKPIRPDEYEKITGPDHGIRAKYECNLSPKQILTNEEGEVTGVEFYQTEIIPGQFDNWGNPKLRNCEEKETIIKKTDTVVIAIGSDPDFGFLRDLGPFDLKNNNYIATDPDTGAMLRNGIPIGKFFAGGDAIGGRSGPEAFHSAALASAAINKLLKVE